ncbi:GTP-binding protein [Pisolithus tinctorius]|nr:GTP-binding protein [Pisolithus tinctorius]
MWRVQFSLRSKSAYRLNSEMAQEYMKKIERFRILVMGRANAGKTTIIQRVCDSTDKPEVFDSKGNKIDGTIVQGTLARGYHRIEHELIFRSNPGFVFHDSCGFEAGAAEEFDQMKDFVVDRAATPRVNERIHVIWFCIPMTESCRTVTAAEQKFFNECDTGHVPVIVLLTKVDTLNLDAIEELEDEGWEIGGAQGRIAEKERELLEKWLAHIKHELGKCKFPPKGYLSLQKMDQKSADCSTLMHWTANVLNEEDLQRLLISTQQSSIALCVQYAVHK